MVQWLRLCAPNARGASLIPDRGTKVLHAESWLKKKPKKLIIIKNLNKINEKEGV